MAAGISTTAAFPAAGTFDLRPAPATIRGASAKTPHREKGVKAGAHSHHRHRFRSLHSSSRAGTTAEETYASPAPVPPLQPHGPLSSGRSTTIPVAASFASGTAPPVHRRVASLKADNAVAFHQQIWGRGAPAEQSRSGRSIVMAPGGSWRHPLRRRRFLIPPHGLAFVGEKYNHPRCCFHRLRHYPRGPSPGCFLESRQRCRFPSAKMGTGSPGRAVPIRAIYRYGAWGKLEASASPAPVPRLLPPHGLAFVREKYNHPRCCFHRLRDGPPRPSSGLLP